MKPVKRKRVNTKGLLILMLVLIVLGAGIHFLHAFQIKRNARGLFDSAQENEVDQPAQAARSYQQYLKFKPHDGEALSKYGLLLSKVAKSNRDKGQAYQVLSAALRQDGQREDVRRLAAKLALEMHRFPDAKAHLEQLPDDVEKLRQLALCEIKAADYEKAVNCYSLAVRCAPTDTALWLDYARLVRDRPDRSDPLKQRQEGAEEIDTMLLRNEGWAAHLAAAHYFHEARDGEKADKHVRLALQQAGKSAGAELLLIAADRARIAGNKREARGYLEQGQRRYPRDLRLPLRLADMEIAERRPEKAVAILKSCLKPMPADPEKLWRLANLFIEAGAADEAGKTIEHMAQKGDTPLTTCLKARQLIQKGAWVEARQLLVPIARRPIPSADLAKRVYLLLGECHQQLGNPDQAQMSYERALAVDSKWLPANLALASTLVALGKLDAAVAVYRKELSQAPELRLELVRLLLAQVTRSPAQARNFAEIDALLTGLAKEMQNTVEIHLLQASTLVAQKKFDAARLIAVAERDRDPKQIAPWLFLAGLAERQEKADAVLPLLDQAEKQAGKDVAWELWRIRHWSRQDKTEARKRLADVESRLGAHAESDRNRLLAALADTYFSLGEANHAKRLWLQLTEAQPNNLGARFVLLDLALQEGNKTEAGKQLAELKRQEGGGAMSAFGEAGLAVLSARDGDVHAFQEARKWLARAAALRPSWAQVPLWEGRIFDIEKQKDRALEKYQLAIDMGLKHLQVYRRVLQLLYEQQRFAEAQALLRKLPDTVLSTPELGPLAAQTMLVQDDPSGPDSRQTRAHALRIARAAVGDKNKDYRAYLWLGQVAEVAEQKDEAEKALRKALDLNDQVAETWVALVFFLARTDQKKAEQELALAQRKLSKDQLAIALAPCHEALGRLKLAEEGYRAEVASQPANAQALRKLASFFLRHGNITKAEPHLERLLDGSAEAPDGTVAWARRKLALTLAARGDYQSFKRALTLIDQNPGEAMVDRRTKALVLATQPSRRAEAIRLFEAIPAKDTSPDVQFLLAQLYEAAGNWKAAQANLLLLVNAHEKSPVFLGRYLRSLLREKNVEQAKPWLDRLIEMSPKGFETIELRARFLKAGDKANDAVALLKSYAEEKNAPRVAVAGLLEELGAYGAAEKALRSFVAATAAKVPESVLLLATHFTRQKRVGEALAVCDQAWKTCRPEAVASACAAVLRTEKASALQQKQVEARIAQAVAETPKNAALPIILATVQEFRGGVEEPVKLYRQAIQLNKNSIAALNNLAYLLALRDGDSPEALELIQKAIEEAGPAPELLDTRALAYLKSNQVPQAMKDLQQAIAERPTPAKYLHLAQAELLAGNRRGAAHALEKISDPERSMLQVHFLERAVLRKLMNE